MSALLSEIGLSMEEIQERVIQKIADDWLDMDEENINGSLLAKLNELTKKKIDEAVETIGNTHILPRVTEIIENVTLQETNQWGEAKGEKLTFIEYLVKRAESYLTEKVDHNGKGKSEAASYSWSGTQTRITHLIHHHLHYSIEKAMKEAVQEINKHIQDGLMTAVKIKLAEVTSKFKISV